MLIPATEKNFDEEGYLTANPDILKAVQSGQFESGAVHFKTIGHMEKRNILVKGENNGSYSQDGITSIHNHDFMSDPAFINAYDRGVKAAGKDYGWHWRVHIGLWAARTAVTLPGDFVECGVNAGFMSSSIMCDLDWNRRGKTFFLLDTFCGIDANQASREEIDEGILEKNEDLIKTGFYVTSSDGVMENFSEWKNVKIIEGVIPETLPQITSNKVSFAHIDLNCAAPEVAAISFLWDRLVTGAIVLLDDYAYSGYQQQKYAMDEFFNNKGCCIASLPTGQGLIIKV